MRLALLLSALCLFACRAGQQGALQGYVEGESIRVAAAAAGRITEVKVARGAELKAGDALFTLDAEREQAAVAEAEHRVSAAAARFADLGKGRRPEELAVLRAQLAQLQAQSRLASEQLRRQRQLKLKGSTSDELVDQAATAAERATAAVVEQEKALQVANLTGRTDTIAAAGEDAKAAEAQLAQARWQLAQKAVTAPAAGSVEEVYYRAGEVVAAGAPVVALLPPGNRKLRFFVPEPLVGGLKLGQNIHASCDACGAPFAAKISFIASEAEFTPPVLYGREQRSRLVFLIEALPDAAVASRLHPGQPLDISLSTP